ncbi:MAG: tetratricopeptide repeat protein, partial [Candidatus Neomarinimicrobiota bacterium]|nr:tetratricopeptide repeat protein [Candidatus Neomarinimicrobiota bacterium]
TIQILETTRGPTVELLIQKSALYEELDDSENALKEILKAFGRDSLNSDVLNRLVNLLLNDKQIDHAENYNQLLIEKFPDDVRGFINTGFLALNRNKPEDAIVALSSCVEKFPNEFTVHYLLGTSYYQVKDYGNAEVYLLQALGIFPDSRNTKHNLALIYDQIGEWSKSDELYLDLVATDSTDAQAFNNYAYSLADRNEDFELALELAKNAIRLVPKSAPYLDTIGWIYYKLNDYEKAIEFIRESLSIDSSNPVIQDHLNAVIKAKSMHVVDKGIQQAGITDTTKATLPFKE